MRAQPASTDGNAEQFADASSVDAMSAECVAVQELQKYMYPVLQLSMSAQLLESADGNVRYGVLNSSASY
jgi:hypothetical protein